jgi:hypothetical protein
LRLLACRADRAGARKPPHSVVTPTAVPSAAPIPRPIHIPFFENPSLVNPRDEPPVDETSSLFAYIRHDID